MKDPTPAPQRRSAVEFIHCVWACASHIPFLIHCCCLGSILIFNSYNKPWEKQNLKYINPHLPTLYQGNPDLGAQLKALDNLIKYLVKLYLFTHSYKEVSLFLFNGLCAKMAYKNIFGSSSCRVWIKTLVDIFKMGQISHPSAYTPFHWQPYLLSPTAECQRTQCMQEPFPKVSVIDADSTHLGFLTLPRQTEDDIS